MRHKSLSGHLCGPTSRRRKKSKDFQRFGRFLWEVIPREVHPLDDNRWETAVIVSLEFRGRQMAVRWPSDGHPLGEAG